MLQEGSIESGDKSTHGIGQVGIAWQGAPPDLQNSLRMLVKGMEGHTWHKRIWGVASHRLHGGGTRAAVPL